MTKLKKFLSLVGLIGLVAGFALVPASGQAQGVQLSGLTVAPFQATYSSDIITAVNTDAAIYVRYVGAATGAATVAVAAADSDIALVANGAADTRFSNCGGTAGTLDTANAACDTLGEIVDRINIDGAGDWVAFLHAGLRGDASANALFTLAATDAKSPNGVALLRETPTALLVDVVLDPKDNGGADMGIKKYTGKNIGPTTKFVENPRADRDSVLLYYSENVASTGAVGNATVYCIVEKLKYKGAASEQANILYAEAGAATTVTGKIDEFLNNGGLVCNGGKLLVRITATTTLTAPTAILTGYVKPRRAQ